MVKPNTLGRFERLLLINQARILEALYPEEAEELAVQREALERGYELVYDWNVFGQIYTDDDVMTPDESLEVWDTLDMYDSLHRAALATGNEDLAEKTKFLGYDGNNESKFMAFAAFSVQRLKRFEYVELAKPGYWNSHSRMREMYERMLNVWKDLPAVQRSDLTPEQLRVVLEAATHPSQR